MRTSSTSVPRCEGEAAANVQRSKAEGVANGHFTAWAKNKHDHHELGIGIGAKHAARLSAITTQDRERRVRAQAEAEAKRKAEQEKRQWEAKVDALMARAHEWGDPTRAQVVAKLEEKNGHAGKAANALANPSERATKEALAFCSPSGEASPPTNPLSVW